MDIHPTTPEQQIKVAEYAVEMSQAGVSAELISGVMDLARSDQGVCELMELWSEAADDLAERDQLLAELQEALDEDEEAPKVPQHKPKIELDQLDGIAADIVSFKTRLRRLIDQHGGVSEVARRSGITQPSLSRMLGSASMPRRTTLYRIARALNLPESEIVTDWVR